MRTRLVSVIGSGKELDKKQAALAEALGAALIKAGYGIVCGGLGGVMEAVCRGAVKARGKSRHPPVVGILPGYESDTGNDYLDLALPTGMGHARNALVVAAGDVTVCVGGATGALSEVGLARKMGRPVIALAGSGGTASLVARAVPAVTGVKTVEEALAKVKEHCS